MDHSLKIVCQEIKESRIDRSLKEPDGVFIIPLEKIYPAGIQINIGIATGIDTFLKPIQC
jgi:hypothetical protein